MKATKEEVLQKKKIKHDEKKAQSCLSMQRLRADKKYTQANRQQHELFGDKRRSILDEQWKASLQRREYTHYSIVANTGRHIFKGKPASCFGPNKCYDYCTSEKELEHLLASDKWVQNPSIIVLQNQKTFESKAHRITSEEWIKIVWQDYDYIDIQDFGCDANKPLAQRMKTTDFFSRWEASNGAISNKPINALNISVANLELTLQPLLKYCMMLSRMTHWLGAEEQGSISKRSKKFLDADIEGSIRWEIAGQAGAFSGWHIDMPATIT